MAIALLKLSDIALRAIFVLVPLYLLRPGTAGQFGLLSTLVALYAFLVGFESYGALQRRLAAEDETQARASAASIVRFYLVNYVLASPIFWMLATLWLKFSVLQTAMALLVVVGEVLSNEAYRLALVARQFQPLFAIAVAKNLIGVVVLLTFVFVREAALSLQTVIQIWAAASTLGLLLVGLRFWRAVGNIVDVSTWSVVDLIGQYRASLAFFSIGIVALLSVQIDRFIVGAVGGLEVAGIYFKNLFIAASVYQLTTVLFYNRIVARVYRAIADFRYREVWVLIRRESVRIALVYLTVIAVAGAILALPEVQELAGRAFLRTEYLIGLIVAFMVRTIADYANVFLNAIKLERRILATHCVTVLAASILNILLTSAMGIRGTVVSVLLGSTVMAFLSWHFLRRAMDTKAKAA
jgi:O-antigen/teichoic acid export membrane protein